MLSRYIFATESLQDKVPQICEFLNETEDLLHCSRFNSSRDQCRMCRRICRFRKVIILMEATTQKVDDDLKIL
jgi:hypothetical protein